MKTSPNKFQQKNKKYKAKPYVVGKDGYMYQYTNPDVTATNNRVCKYTCKWRKQEEKYCHIDPRMQGSFYIKQNENIKMQRTTEKKTKCRDTKSLK